MSEQKLEYHVSVREVIDWLVQTQSSLVAFGQTVFWDEPMKVILLNALRERSDSIPFTLGVHDVDYFSKLPGRDSPSRKEDTFAIVSRNDGSTRELWAAVAELAILFGSETPVQVTDFHSLNAPLVRLTRESGENPARFVDRWTEAWGWRAIAYTGDSQPVASEIETSSILEILRELWKWGLEDTAALVVDEKARAEVQKRSSQLLSLLDEAANHGHVRPDCPSRTDVVSCLYQRLLPRILKKICGRDPGDVTISSTFRYLQFNRENANLRRFYPLQLFLDPETRSACLKGYNQSVAGTGIYPLHRFGEGALPFDVIVSGQGRGTIRILGRDVSVRFQSGDVFVGMLAEPTVESLADLFESRFGEAVAVSGKALMLPVMLCSESVMVISETASGYLERTRKWVWHVARSGLMLDLKPIVRMRYTTLDSLGALELKFSLPEHIAEVINAPQLAASEFAARWRSAVNEQTALIEWLAENRSHDALLARLEAHDSHWETPRKRFQELCQASRERGQRIEEWQARIDHLEEERHEIAVTIREVESLIRKLKQEMASTSPPLENEIRLRRQEAIRQRETLVDEIRSIRNQESSVAAEISAEMKLTDDERLREEKRAIEHEIDQQRLRIVRNAILVVRGLSRANLRPCAWWLPLLDSHGDWFRAVSQSTEAYFEQWLEPPQES